MAQIDVSELITDPDFSDDFVLIKRTASFNQYVEMNLTETPQNVTGVVQGIDSKTLDRMPNSAELFDGIRVWYRGVLSAEIPGGYCDVILWNGYRYLVKKVDQDFINWGTGWSSAVCSKEVPNAG